MVPLLLPLVLMTQPPAPADWKATLIRERREKNEGFKQGPTSPMAGLQRWTVSTGTEAAFAVGPRGLAMTQDAPSVAIQIRPTPQGWGLVTPSGSMTVPPGTTLTLERFTLQVQTVSEGLLVQVFDPQRPERTAFKGLRYFPPDPTWVVSARFEPLSDPKPVMLPTTRQEQKAFTLSGRLHFVVQGKACTLLAYAAGGSATLFIPFTDRTTGRTTYSVGRFLEAAPPEGGRCVLDFNRAYNPLCNYASIYNCPIPPRENRLPVAVRAGEKTYPHE